MQDKLTEAMLADGWLPHDGGPCPVGRHTIISVKLRDGTVFTGSDAAEGDGWDWEETGEGWCIIAYKLEPKP